MTISKRYVSGAAILFALMLIMLVMQNTRLHDRLAELQLKNEHITQQSLQINTLSQEITLLEVENAQIGQILITESQVADNYRAIVGETSQTDLITKAKEIVAETPLDFEAAYAVAKYSAALDLNVSLILSVMDLESNFGQFEVGTSDDRGYMQIIPSTEEWLANTYGENYGLTYDPSRIFEPEYNIGLAAIYLSLLQNAYGNDYDRILSEYNRGPYNLKEYYLENQTYVTTYSRVVLGKEQKYLALNN